MKIRTFCIAGRCGLIVFSLLITQLGFSEIISPDRRITWQGNVGVKGGIPDSSTKTVYVTLPAGSSVATVNTAINNCPSNQIIRLAAGNYSFAGDLEMDKSGVVLQGAGRGSTIITFTSGRVRFRATFSDSALSADANLTADAVQGSTVLTVSPVPSWVTVGELIGIDQLDDPAIVNGFGTQPGDSFREMVGNGARGMAQLNRVTAKTATTITLELPLFYSWKMSRTAQIFQPYYNPSTTRSLKYAGLEDMTLRQAYTGGTDSHMISMEIADSCWLKNIESDNVAGGCHVWPIFSYRCEFRGSYFHDSHLWSGGQGYGVALYHVSTALLTENNIFRRLHNATTVNYGSSGNVFAYNYELDGFSDSTQNPGMNTHGVHTFMNLWEGNYCEDKVLSDWTHGSSSHNTVFRSRVTGENGSGDGRTCISIEYYNRYWNVVGNVLGTVGMQNKRVSHSGSTSAGSGGSIMRMGGEVNINSDYSPSDAYSYTSGMFVLDHGNYDTVTAGQVWESAVSDRTLPNSLYLSSKPSWFGNRPWPPFDPANPSTAAITNLPAGYRYIFGVDPPTGPVNLAPIARVSASPTSGNAPLAVTFSSSGSVDPEGTPLTYSWAFGDGGTSTLANPSRTYQTDGTYVARLTVSDGTNSTTSSNLTIRVGNQPPVVIANASPTSGFAPLTVAFSTAGSSDPEGATLSYAWTFGDGGTSTAANPTHAYPNAGSYLAQVTVSDGVKTTVTNVTISVVDPAAALVAAYGFEEGAGTSVADRSGNGNTGSITAAAWATGRFGRALSFNGVDALVTVNDSASLGLSSGFTLEAWVNPATLGTGWRNIIYKEPDVYFLMGATPQGPPNMGGSFASANVSGTGPLPLNTWTHLAGTYDGATMRFYTNGVLVASRAQTGSVAASPGALTIGGDLVTHDNGPQYWSGLIDEVRIYNRALTATEIQVDMNTAVSGGAAKPAPPTGLRVAGAQ